jgi:hypothetical protein
MLTGVAITLTVFGLDSCHNIFSAISFTSFTALTNLTLHSFSIRFEKLCNVRLVRAVKEVDDNVE